MVARMVLLQFWWPTRRHADGQERVPSKGTRGARFFSAQGTRTSWFCESSCTYKAGDTRINLVCCMR